MTKRIAAIMGMLLAPAGAAQAIDWQGEWQGHADLGYSASSGNSDTENLNAALGLEYKTVPWTHSLDLLAIRGEESGSTSAERYEAEVKSKYALSDVSYVFGDLIYEQDEFGGTRKRTAETIGYGRTLIDSELQVLTAELGIGARQAEMQDGTEDNEAILRTAAEYHRHISETTEFNQELLVESGESNTYVESVSALKMKINGNLYAKLGYTVKYNDTVPADVEHTDSYTNVSLSYEF